MSRKAGIILSAILGIIIALWMWTAIIPKNALSIGGSTSVDPVMQRLTNTYRKNGGDSFVYSSSGSAGGVSNAKSGTYKMGFISKEIPQDGSFDPIQSIDTPFDSNGLTNDAKSNSDIIKSYLKKTEENNTNTDAMHYVQIAEDAIILTYQAPKSFNDAIGTDFDLSFEQDGKTVKPEWQSVIKTIYEGKATWTEVAHKIADIKHNKQTNYYDQKLDFSECNQTIVAFARETGSGTRNTFDKMFGLNAANATQPSRATEFNSNGMMFNNFKVNTFGYVSMNYMDAIRSNANLNTVRVSGTNPKDDGFGINSITNYKLKRPYIGLIKSNLAEKEINKISDFLGWIATATAKDANSTNSKAYKQYETEGLHPMVNIDWKLPNQKNITNKENRDDVQNTNPTLKYVFENVYLDNKN